MRKWKTGCVRWLTAVATTMLVGCGDAEPVRQPLAGSVSVAGRDAVDGLISLFPTEGHAGAAISAPVERGHYEFSSVDGPFPGVYQVVIAIHQNHSPEYPGSDNGPAAKLDLLNEPDSPPASKTTASKPIEFRTRLEINIDGASSQDFTFP